MQIYHSFRNTTFTLFPLFVFRFLPVALGCTVVAEVVRCVLRGSAKERSGSWVPDSDLDLPQAVVHSVDRSR